MDETQENINMSSQLYGQNHYNYYKPQASIINNVQKDETQENVNWAHNSIVRTTNNRPLLSRHVQKFLARQSRKTLYSQATSLIIDNYLTRSSNQGPGI